MTFLSRVGVSASLLVVAVAGGGCTLIALCRATNTYESLVQNQERCAPSQPCPATTELAGLAASAAAKARAQADPETAVTFWRVAADSAWKGKVGFGDMNAITTAGTAACDQLDAAHFRAPGDCLEICMAGVRSGYDHAQDEYHELERKRSAGP